MSDDMIKRLAENGGVIQINFGSSFVTKESQEKRSKNAEVVAAFAKQNNLESDDSKVKEYAKQVALDNPVFCEILGVARVVIDQPHAAVLAHVVKGLHGAGTVAGEQYALGA